ncbi:MAG: type II toxin-antitoxin system VapC family toxin [Sporichthyaceae bacterium]
MFFVDTNVFVYARVPESVQHAGSVRVLRAIGADPGAATTSVAVIEELWHLELAGRLPDADGLALAAFTLMRPVLAVTDDMLAEALRDPGLPVALGANDRLHVACARAHGLAAILTADRAFDGVDQVLRVDPADLEAVDALLRG